MPIGTVRAATLCRRYVAGWPVCYLVAPYDVACDIARALLAQFIPSRNEHDEIFGTDAADA